MQRLRSLSRLWAPFSRSNASTYAASSSFFILLSVFPAVLFFLALLPYLPISLQQWLDFLEELVPAPFFPVVTYVFETVRTNSTLTLLSLSAVTTLWSASRGILYISDGLDAVLQHHGKRRYLYRRVMSIVYFLLLALALSTMLTVHVFGETVMDACIRWFPHALDLAEALYHLRFFYFILIFGMVFSLIYWLFPRRALRFRCCLFSGMLTALGWIVISQLFSIYVNHFAGYIKLYGGIGLLILACIWLNFCILLFLYGAVLSGLLHQRAYHPIRIIKEAFSRS